MHHICRTILATFLAGAQVAHAAVDCTGTVTSLSVQLGGEGTVTLSLSGGPTYTYLCDIAGIERNGVDRTVCKVMYASLLAAKATNKQVLIRFNNYNLCTDVPPWADAGSLGWTRILD